MQKKFEITEDEYETIGEKPTAQSNSISGSFYGRNSDGNWRIMEDEDSEGADMERLANWFKAVPEIIVEVKPPEENPSDDPKLPEDDEKDNPTPGGSTGDNTEENPSGNTGDNTEENPSGNTGDNTGENPGGNTEDNPEQIPEG